MKPIRVDETHLALERENGAVSYTHLLYLKDLRLLGCTALDAGVFARLVGLIERGAIRPLVARSFPLRDIVLAQQEFLEKRHVGKLVLIPPAVAEDDTQPRA